MHGADPQMFGSATSTTTRGADPITFDAITKDDPEYLPVASPIMFWFAGSAARIDLAFAPRFGIQPSHADLDNPLTSPSCGSNQRLESRAPLRHPRT